MSVTRVQRMGRFTISETMLTEMLVDWLGLEGVRVHSVHESGWQPGLTVTLVGDSLPQIEEGHEIPELNIIFETVVKRQYRTTVEVPT